MFVMYQDMMFEQQSQYLEYQNVGILDELRKNIKDPTILNASLAS